MQSKISCFNKTIFIKNLTRFWPFAVLYAAYLIFAHPLALYVELAHHFFGEMNDSWDKVANHFAGLTEPVSVFIFAIIMATAVFGYLLQSRSANMLHAFPVTRGELYVTNFVSALVLMLIPQFLTALATNFVIIGKVPGLIWAVWAWFGITAGETVFFMGLAALAVMFTGQLLPAVVFYMIWNFLYVAVVGLIDAVAELFVFGLSGNLIGLRAHVLFPLARFLRYVGFDVNTMNKAPYLEVAGMGTLFVYVLAGLIFAAAAYYAYRKRALECAGDFLSFGFTKPIFRWGAAILAGGALSLVVTAIVCDGRGSQSHAATLFTIWLVIFSAVLFFVAEMFIEKSFRVFKKRMAVECVSCIAVLLVGVALLNFDVFGVESYVPDMSEVAMAEVSGDGWASFESAEEMEKIAALHQLILERVDEHKKKEDGGYGETDTFFGVGIHYRMKDGKQVDRFYSLWLDDKEYADRIWSSFSELMYDREAVKRSYFGMNYEELDWKVADVALEYFAQGNDLYCPVYGTGEELQRFYEAALADIGAGAFSNGNAEYVDDHTIVMHAGEDAFPMDATLSLTLMTEKPRESVRFAGMSEIYSQDDGGEGTVTVTTPLYLNSDCTHLINLLIEMGVIDSAQDLSAETIQK